MMHQATIVFFFVFEKCRRYKSKYDDGAVNNSSGSLFGFRLFEPSILWTNDMQHVYYKTVKYCTPVTYTQ